jgi:hypothetical protein
VSVQVHLHEEVTKAENYQVWSMACGTEGFRRFALVAGLVTAVTMAEAMGM